MFPLRSGELSPVKSIMYVISTLCNSQIAQIRVVLQFKDQISADTVRKQLKELSLPKSAHHHSARVCEEKIVQELKVKESKPLIINQQCVDYSFQCDLFDAGFLGYTRGHLHNSGEGHKYQSSSIAKPYKSVHGTVPHEHLSRFEVLKKCRNKFDCLERNAFYKTLKAKS